MIKILDQLREKKKFKNVKWCKSEFVKDRGIGKMF